MDGGVALNRYPIAYSMIKRYALVPLVCRRVERVHAELKQLGKSATNMSPPLISATLREGDHLRRLKSDPKFKDFVLQKWRAKGIFDDALQHVIPQEELVDLTRLGKANLIYLCGLSSEFKDVTVEREAHREFLAHTAHRRRGGPDSCHSHGALVPPT